MKRAELRVFLMDWFCGCGSPSEASASLLRLLDLHPVYQHREEFNAFIADDGAAHLLLYILDHFGLTEHGSNVSGAWLTSKGYEVRDALRREQADDFEALHSQYCAHGFDLDDLDTHDCVNTPVPDEPARRQHGAFAALLAVAKAAARRRDENSEWGATGVAGLAGMTAERERAKKAFLDRMLLEAAALEVEMTPSDLAAADDLAARTIARWQPGLPLYALRPTARLGDGRLAWDPTGGWVDVPRGQ